MFECNIPYFKNVSFMPRLLHTKICTSNTIPKSTEIKKICFCLFTAFDSTSGGSSAQTGNNKDVISINSSSNRALREFHSVAALQDQAQVCLSKYIESTYRNQSFRFGKILLLLPSLRHVRGKTIEEVFFRKTIGGISIERLLVDMFKSESL